MDVVCQRQKKWDEIPCVQFFMALYQNMTFKTDVVIQQPSRKSIPFKADPWWRRRAHVGFHVSFALPLPTTHHPAPFHPHWLWIEPVPPAVETWSLKQWKKGKPVKFLVDTRVATYPILNTKWGKRGNKNYKLMGVSGKAGKWHS